MPAEVLSSQQRLLRRAWLLGRLPSLTNEAAFHRQHETYESQVVFVLWRLDAPRGSLTLSNPKTDWPAIGEKMRASGADERLIAALLAVLVLNDYRGVTPDFLYKHDRIIMTWPLVGIDFTMAVRVDAVELDYGTEGHTEHWTHQAVKDAFERVRKASCVVV
jgi:hypothetical protein